MPPALPSSAPTGPQVLVLACPPTLPAAETLAAPRPGATAVVMPHDLSRAGWTYSDRAGAVSFASAAGRFPAARLEHVVVLLEAIAPAHLPHIAPSDRGYVASEMTAFLRAWLAGLRCRVWNAPNAVNLAGPEPVLGVDDSRWASLSAALAEVAS